MEAKNEDKSKINTDDSWNRSVYGSPTVGGVIVIGSIIAFVVYHIFFN